MKLNQYLPIGLLSALTLKLTILGANLPEMGMIFALVGLLGLREYLEKNKSTLQIKEECLKEISEIKAIVKMQNEAIEKMARVIDEQRTNVASLKLAAGMRKVGS